MNMIRRNLTGIAVVISVVGLIISTTALLLVL